MSNLIGHATLKGRLNVVYTDYNDLDNKPEINGHILVGNQSGHDLGLADLTDIINVEANPAEAATEDLKKLKVRNTTYNIPEVIVYGEASGSIASFPDGGDNKPLKSLTIGISPIQASGTPTPSNPLPISGWTGANVYNMGILQLMEATQTSTSSNGITLEYLGSGKYKASGTAESTTNIVLNLPINPLVIYDGTDSYIRFNNNIVSNGTELRLYNGSTQIETWAFTALNRVSAYTGMRGKTIDNIRLRIPITQGNTYDIRFQPMLYANNITDEYNISWQTEAGTVYGGTIAIYPDGSGEMDINKAIVDLSSLAWGTSGEVNANTGMIRYVQTISDKEFGKADMMCNIFPTKATTGYDTDTTESISGITVSNALYLVIDSNRLSGDLSTREARATALLSWLSSNPASVVYNIETPQHIDFPAGTFPTIKSLLGTNNIWADTGDVEELTYQRDLNICINLIIQSL